MNIDQLRTVWRERRGEEAPTALSKDLIARALAYWTQEERLGGLSPRLLRLLASVSKTGSHRTRHLKVGSVIVREYQGRLHEVTVVPNGFCWQGHVYSSLSTVAQKITGTNWNGPRFFGLRPMGEATSDIPCSPRRITGRS
jgi:Protein of unknown function (DUF2924)